MYAILSDRGRQTTVRVGDVVQLDLDSGAQPGQVLVFDQVLLVGGDKGVRIGTPLVSGASVKAEVVDQIRGKKVRVKRGHRQDYTRVKITAIEG
jgi:large subunit ribosomal protein L21